MQARMIKINIQNINKNCLTNYIEAISQFTLMIKPWQTRLKKIYTQIKLRLRTILKIRH